MKTKDPWGKPTVCNIVGNDTVWKMFKYRVFSGPYFPHSDWIQRNKPYLSVFSLNAGKYGPEKTPYLDTFHAVLCLVPTKNLKKSHKMLISLSTANVQLQLKSIYKNNIQNIQNLVFSAAYCPFLAVLQ